MCPQSVTKKEMPLEDSRLGKVRHFKQQIQVDVSNHEGFEVFRCSCWIPAAMLMLAAVYISTTPTVRVTYRRYVIALINRQCHVDVAKSET